MAVIRTSALILRHTTDREHDRLLTLLTPSGQHRVRARGTKKSVSKLGGSLEPMTEVDINIADGRVIGLVTGSIILDRFETLRRDVVGMTMGQWWLELVEAVTKPEQDSSDVYTTAVTTLRTLADTVDLSIGRRWMMLCRHALLLMMHEGFAPPIDQCSVCHKPLTDDNTAYDPRLGFVHQAEAGEGSVHLATATMAFLRHEQQPDNERDAFAQAHKLMETLVHHTLDRPLKSEQVLRSVIRLAKLPKRPG
jgi:DNA repair protein RecO (recombination protein O)